MMHERQLSIPQGGSTWQPSVVLEGRVRRLMGPLFGGEGTRYAEMYVHDAMSGNCTGEDEEPSIVAASNGHVVLPKSATEVERTRVGHLFDLIFNYIRHCNTYVQDFVVAAQELLNRNPEDIDHYVIVVRGKEKEEDVRKRACYSQQARSFTMAA